MSFKNQTIWLLFIIILMASSCRHSNTVTDREGFSYFEEQLKAVVTNYIRIKNALVNENSKNTAKEARVLRAYLEGIQTENLSAKVQKKWIDSEKALRRLTASIGTSDSLNEQRKQFKEVSSILIETVEEFGAAGLTLYLQHCSKALNGEGASWINEKEEVQNPYQGGLHCGKVEKRIEG